MTITTPSITGYIDYGHLRPWSDLLYSLRLLHKVVTVNIPVLKGGNMAMVSKQQNLNLNPTSPSLEPA